jgi:hypothetical protein
MGMLTVPKGPRGEKRPGDVIGAAIMVAKIATGEVEDNATPEGASSIARQGGEARARKLSPAQRSAIAKQAAEKRWRRD